MILFNRTIILCLLLPCFSYLFRSFWFSLHDATKYPLTIRNKIDPYQYVHDAFRNNHYTTTEKWKSKEPLFVPITYEMKENIVWNGKSMCYNDTFILLMYFVHKKEVERRQTIRKYVKQNMIVDGKKINYVFVVASLLNDTQSMNELKAENSKYGDLLISVHEDNYRLVPITILDAYYWVREYCKTVTFVARIDGDVWIHLGNLLHYLQEIPRAKMVVGLPCEIKHYGETFYYKGIPNIPFDYPRPIHFVGGGAYVLSRDVIPYINIGTMYMNVLLPISEDIIVSEILRRVGIGIYPPSPKYSIYIDYQPGMTIPSNIVFLHYLKDMSLFNSIYSMYSSSYLIPYYKY